MADDLETDIVHVLAPFKPELVILFGSVAAGRATAFSDLDVAVKLSGLISVDIKMAMIDGLAGLTGRPIDLVDLRRVGEPLLGEILFGGRRLYGAVSEWADLQYRHLVNVEDFVPQQQAMLRARRNQWLSR